MPKPSFFIIGAPKCGTTTLYHWLKEHPDIFMPTAKEPHYFTQHLSDRYCRVRDQDAYLDYFKTATDNQLCGEASVLYGFYPESIKAILQFNPTAKFIFMIRNPISMAPSYHRQLLNNLEEDIQEFEAAWNTDNKRVLPKTSTDPQLLNYKNQCKLGQHLQTLMTLIPQNQLLIILLDDMQNFPQNTYQKTLKFLNLKDDNRQSFNRENQAAVIQSRSIEKFITNAPLWVKASAKILKKWGLPLGDIIQKLNRKPINHATIPPAIKKELVNYFEKDIQLIEKLTKRSLPHWRE